MTAVSTNLTPFHSILHSLCIMMHIKMEQFNAQTRVACVMTEDLKLELYHIELQHTYCIAPC